MNFEYISPSKILYGADSVKNISEYVRSICEEDNVMLVTDPGIIKVGIAEKVVAYLKEAGMRVRIYSGVKSYPSTECIDDAADMIRTADSKCIIGLGGGSVMDVAKTAALVALDNKPTEYYAMGANPFKKKVIKSIMVPTTAGTGAEVIPASIFSLTNGKNVWGLDMQMLPDIVVLDPVLTTTLPTNLTAGNGLNAFIHAYEAVVSKESNPMIQAIGLYAIKLLLRSLIKVIKKPENIEARGDLIVGAMMSGLAITADGANIRNYIEKVLEEEKHVQQQKNFNLTLHKINDEKLIDVHVEVAKALGAKDDGRSNKELAYEGFEIFHKLVLDLESKPSLDKSDELR